MILVLVILVSFLSIVSPSPNVIKNNNVTAGYNLRQAGFNSGPWNGGQPQRGFGAVQNPSNSQLLPFVRSGTCQGGRIYTIQSVQDLFNYGPELECVFFSGLSPTGVPTGPLKGSVLSILNIDIFDATINRIWRGKVQNEIQCPSLIRDPSSGEIVSTQNVFYLGWNNLLGHLIVPFLSRLDVVQENLSQGEYFDGRMNWIIDYTQEFSTLCEDFDALKRSQERDIPPRNMFPLNQSVDALRLVGRTLNGAAIYLGKTYMRDSNKVSSTVVYFAFVNYDARVNPEFQSGQSLPPLSNSFSYTIPGVGQ